MIAHRTIQKVAGTTLNLTVPADLAGKVVEILIQPLESGETPLAPEQDPRYAPYIMPKPALTEEDKILFERNPYPLRGTGGKYLDPFEPAAPPEDWDVYRTGGEGKSG